MIGAALLAAAAQGAQAATLDVVRQRGAVTCGTTTGFAGFSAPDAQGKWQGLDVDLCRAVAAAVFGDADKIRWCRSIRSSVSPPCNRARWTC